MFKCYSCGDKRGTVIADKDDMRFGCYGEDKYVIECVDCGLVQLYPQWTEEELDDLYAKYSEKVDFKGQKRKVRVSKYLKDKISPEGWVLEVGCGAGDNVKYLTKHGVEVVGIDKEDGDSWEGTSPVVDFIYAIHLAEHLKDPIAFALWCSAHADKWLLEIPCIEDPLLKLYKNKAFEKFYWYPYHLFFFSKKTANDVFRNVKITRRQEYGIVNHLRWFFRGKPGNWNPHIPIIDDIYKYVLKSMGYSDTLIIEGGV